MKMSEKRAWEFIAKKWDNPNQGESYVFVSFGGGISAGLCTSITILYDLCKISERTYLSMSEKINGRIESIKKGRSDARLYELVGKSMYDSIDGYLFPTTLEGAKKRASLCREFSRKIKCK